MTLHWYSPLDVQRTDIACYSARVLPELAAGGHVLAVSDGAPDQQQVAPDWVRALPLPAGEDERRMQRALPVYHIGNNAQHLPIVEQAWREPGIVVLHDLNLIDLARVVGAARQEPGWWRRMLELQYGEACRGLLEESAYSPDAERWLMARFPLFLPFIHNALGVVVHSTMAEQAIHQQYPGRFNLLRLQLPYPAPAAPSEIAGRDYGERPLRIVFCGHAGINRRLLEFVEAWGGLACRDQFRLDVFGKCDNATALRGAARSAGVEQWLEFHGYVGEAELDRAMARAHLALNLRWPSMGEASGSQLRYWAAGLPALVTATGWYEDLPDDTVGKIDPADEIASLRRYLTAFADPATDGGKYATMGAAGYRHLQREHAIADYVEALAGFARQVIHRRLDKHYLEHHLVDVVAGLCPDERSAPLFGRSLTVAAELLAPAGRTTMKEEKIGQ